MNVYTFMTLVCQFLCFAVQRNCVSVVVSFGLLILDHVCRVHEPAASAALANYDCFLATRTIPTSHSQRAQALDSDVLRELSLTLGNILCICAAIV